MQFSVYLCASSVNLCVPIDRHYTEGFTEERREKTGGFLPVLCEPLCFLCDSLCPKNSAEPFLENVNLLIRNARQAGAPVFFVQHANRGTLTAGSQAWQLHPAIQPLAGETVIHKRHGDAFEETDLQAALGARGVRTLVVTGLVTHGCVKATCMGALERGYGVVLVADGHSSFSKQAADLIEKWNRKLGEMGAQLKEARQIGFGR